MLIYFLVNYNFAYKVINIAKYLTPNVMVGKNLGLTMKLSVLCHLVAVDPIGFNCNNFKSGIQRERNGVRVGRNFR